MLQGLSLIHIYLLLYKAYPWKQNVRGLNEGIYLYNLKTGETKTLLEPDTMHTGTIELDVYKRQPTNWKYFVSPKWSRTRFAISSGLDVAT